MAPATDWTKYQKTLIEAGYDVGPDGADGDWGPNSLAALKSFQADHGIEVTGNFDRPTLQRLFPKPERTSVMSKWLTSFVGTTAFKYLVAMIATYAAGKLGLDPIEGKATIEGILSQFIGVVMGFWGMWEARREKIVIDGQKVAMKELNSAEKQAVQAIVAEVRSAAK